MGRANAEAITPEMFLTVFGFIARGSLFLRVRPPPFSNRTLHARHA
jgi:hypothetical protein